MWIITIYYTTDSDDLDTRNAECYSYRLLGGLEYTIGRKDCVIPLPTNDPSISRHHATIVVTSTPASVLNKPTTFFPKLHIIDFSKHGTVVDGMSIPPMTKKTSATSGSTLIFGRSVMAVVHFSPMICYISKTVYPHNVEQLKIQIGQLCGFATEADDNAGNIDMNNSVWTQQELREAGVSPSCLLYIAEGLVPERGLNAALLERYCLVSPAYVPALARVAKDTPAIPLSSLPPPSTCEAPRELSLEKLPYRRPEPQLYDALEFSKSQPPNPGATFRTLHLIFLEADCFKLYAESIRQGGGRATLITAYDVMAWYQQNTSAAVVGSAMTTALANNSSSSPSRRSPVRDQPSTTSGGAAVLPLSSDSTFPLRCLLQDSEAHGTNTFIVASNRSFMATLELVQQGIQEGATATRKSQRTIVALPPPSGTVADAVAHLYLKAKLPIVRDTNILYSLYAEDAATFIAGHGADKSPTNKFAAEADSMHFEFQDPSIAASALHVEIEEATETGRLHAAKRHNLTTMSTTDLEKVNSPSALNSIMRALDGERNPRSSQSPASSVSTVDNVAPYSPTAAMMATPTSPTGGAGGGHGSAQRRIQFNEDHNPRSLNESVGGGGSKNMSLLRQQSSFNPRQKVVCCAPERLYAQPGISPRRERDQIAKRSEDAALKSRDAVATEAFANAGGDDTAAGASSSSAAFGDALYAKWQSFYEASRTSDVCRTNSMTDNQQQSSSAVGRRSPVLANGNYPAGSAAVVNVGGAAGRGHYSQARSNSPAQVQVLHSPHRRSGSQPFVVSQSSLPRGGSPYQTHKRAAHGDVNVPNTAPFAQRVLRGSSPSSPRLLMSVSSRNVDSRLLQYCHELYTKNLPNIETAVLMGQQQEQQQQQQQQQHDGRGTDPGQPFIPNADLLKQRVMRYLVDIDLLLTESRRSAGAHRPGSPSRRSHSPMLTAAQNEAHKAAADCRSRLSVLLTVLGGADEAAAATLGGAPTVGDAVVDGSGYYSNSNNVLASSGHHRASSSSRRSVSSPTQQARLVGNASATSARGASPQVPYNTSLLPKRRIGF